MHKFKELKVWQKARETTVNIYALTAAFPEQEKFGISSQLRRAALSVCNNIAEGSARESSKFFVHFLDIAYASCIETESILIICSDLKYINQNQFLELEKEINDIQKMIFSLKKTISGNPGKKYESSNVKSHNQTVE